MIPKSKHISPPWFGAGKDLIDMGLPNRQVKRDVYGSGYATLARLSINLPKTVQVYQLTSEQEQYGSQSGEMLCEGIISPYVKRWLFTSDCGASWISS